MTNFIKLFPSYEDVFYDDIENHKKYFLPICSFNLKIVDPTKDQWLHIVSVKEIYDGRGLARKNQPSTPNLPKQTVLVSMSSTESTDSMRTGIFSVPQQLLLPISIVRNFQILTLNTI